MRTFSHAFSKSRTSKNSNNLCHHHSICTYHTIFSLMFNIYISILIPFLKLTSILIYFNLDSMYKFKFLFPAQGKVHKKIVLSYSIISLYKCNLSLFYLSGPKWLFLYKSINQFHFADMANNASILLANISFIFNKSKSNSWEFRLQFKISTIWFLFFFLVNYCI